MRLRLVLAALLVVCLGSTLWAAEPKFKSAEVKHFERAEGVELSPEFSDLLYAEIKNALKKSKLVGQPIGEGEVIDTADAPNSIIIAGNVLEYKKEASPRRSSSASASGGVTCAPSSQPSGRATSRCSSTRKSRSRPTRA